jgi:hypothetical protein
MWILKVEGGQEIAGTLGFDTRFYNPPERGRHHCFLAPSYTISTGRFFPLTHVSVSSMGLRANMSVTVPIPFDRCHPLRMTN